MGSGQYIICEWKSVRKEYPKFQQAFKNLEIEIIQKCNVEWAPRSFGYLVPAAGQYGRTTILPALFDDHNGFPMTHWRQRFTVAGDQTIMNGRNAGNTIPEDFKIAWMGIALPNKEQHLTEIKLQIGDRKYMRMNIEEVKAYETPAIIFEEGFVIDEETAFDLYGFVQGPIPVDHEGNAWQHQHIVLIGAAYYKQIDRVLGNPGAAIIST